MTQRSATKSAGLPERGLGHLLREISRAFENEMQGRLARYGVTLSQWLHLRSLWDNPGMTCSAVSQISGRREGVFDGGPRRSGRARFYSAGKEYRRPSDRESAAHRAGQVADPQAHSAGRRNQFGRARQCRRERFSHVPSRGRNDGWKSEEHKSERAAPGQGQPAGSKLGALA